MSSESSKIKRNLYYWEDFHFNNLKESTVGRKGLSLFELKDMDVPVPEFFVVSSTVFDKLVSESLLRDSAKLLENGKNPEESEVLNSLLKTEMDDDFMNELISTYARLSGFTDAWVSVRSSVVFPSVPDVSFSGIFLTELNVRGIKNLVESIKKIYASLFTDDVVAYASGKGINLSDVKLAVVVQRMVQAEVSGVSFTIDPITQDPSKLSIEAVFGLGDTISLGELTPDTYLLNKKDLSVFEKRISPQEWMKVRVMSKSDSKSGTQKIKISSNWSHRQKLEDKHLKEISKISLIVENKVRRAQNIEWVMAGGKIWVLQSKDLYETVEESKTIIENNEFDTLAEVLKWSIDKYSGIDMIENKAVEHAKKIVRDNKHEMNSFTEKLINIAKSRLPEKPKASPTTMSERQEYLAVRGIGASSGNVTGEVIVLEKDKDLQISKRNILVIKKYATEMESLIVHCGGVIMETGGITSDTAILCREFDIPAIVSAQNASSILKDGDIVRLDGNSGVVYKQNEIEKSELQKTEEEYHPVIEAYREENLNSIDLLHNVQPSIEQLEEKPLLRIPKDMSLLPSATKVFINPTGKISEMVDYVGNAHGLVYIDLDKILLSIGRHPLAFVDDKKFVDYSKKISEKVSEIADLAQGEQVILSIGSSSVGEFRDITRGKEFESHGLDNSIHGLSHYIANRELLKRVLMIVKRIRNVYKKRNMDIAIHAPINGAYVKEFKKSLSAVGLRKTSTFRIFAIIDSPTEVIMADDILDSNIDGFVLNMSRIVRVMQGFAMDDKDAKYNLGVNSAFKIVDVIADVTRNTSKNVIVMAENNKDLIKYCVQTGVYGISVNYNDIREARKLVSDEEAKIILSR